MAATCSYHYRHSWRVILVILVCGRYSGANGAHGASALVNVTKAKWRKVEVVQAVQVVQDYQDYQNDTQHQWLSNPVTMCW